MASIKMGQDIHSILNLLMPGVMTLMRSVKRGLWFVVYFHQNKLESMCELCDMYLHADTAFQMWLITFS